MDADLKELRELFAHDAAEWKPIRDEGTRDMQFAAGDPWDRRDRDAREKASRPCINADELSQYINQVVNDVRANKRAVKFTPSGNGADDKSAQFYADKMREIEYRSRAQIGYTTAFENAVTRSFGFLRVNTRYATARSVHQDLWIDPVPNPNLITPDASALMPDLSDMQRCWVREQWSLDDFNRKWADQRITRFTSDLGSIAADWVKPNDSVMVGEYWKIRLKSRKLLILKTANMPDPVGFFEDELDGEPLPAGVTLVESREVDDPQVIQQLTNGLEIIEETTWPGKYIPIIGCFGKVLYVSESGSDRRKILSMIRLARDPQLMVAFLATAEAETVGQLTKFPYFSYEGQLTQKSLDAIAQSIHEPVAVVQVKATFDGLPSGTILPFPQRNPWTLDLGSLEIAKESFRRAIQSSMGQTPLPTAAQRRNEKSGVALKHIEELGQRGSFHFVDHYLDMLTQTGIICEDLIGKIYDTARDVGIRKDDDKAEIVRINDPSNPASFSTKGDHLVTVSTGLSFDSEREQANEFVDGFIQSPYLQAVGPQKAAQILAKSIKLKNLGPQGDQLAEIIYPEPAKDGQPTAEQLQQQMQQAQGQMQEMQQKLQEAGQIIQTEQVKAQADLKKIELQGEAAAKKADIEADRDLAIQVMKDATTIAVAHIAAASKGAQMTAHAAEEGAAMGIKTIHQQHDRAHELAMAAVDHAHATAQGQQGHEQDIEAAQQQADLTPEPDATGTP